MRKHRHTLQLSAITAAVTASLMVCATLSSGEVIYFEDFDDYQGGEPEGLFLDDGSSSDPFYTLHSGGFRAQVDSGVNDINWIGFGPTSNGSLIQATDFEFSVDVLDWGRDPTGSDERPEFWLALMARGDESIQYRYDLMFRPSRVDGDLLTSGRLVLVNQNPWPSREVLAEAEFASRPDGQFRLVLSGVGDLLTGKIYDLDDLAKPLVSISARDETHSSGPVGVIANSLNQGEQQGLTDFTVDNLKLSIPEVNPETSIQQGVRISWLATNTDYVVEGASTVGGPWAPVDQRLSQIIDGQVVVSVVAESKASFFRLQQAQ